MKALVYSEAGNQPNTYLNRELELVVEFADK
jgi:hypothetical protein